MVVPWILIALAVPPPEAASSASLGDTVLVLPEIAVERERVASAARRRQPTASVSELEAGAAGRALESLAELLGGAAGVRIVQYGGLGAFSTVSLRGAPPGQVAVFLDGEPVSGAAHGVVSLADLPVTAIERVEVYRGSGPLDLGAAAPGGAIHLVTGALPGRRAVRLARGAFGTWEARGEAGGRRGDLSGFLHGGYQRSRGDFRYPDDNGTPFNPADDSLSVRVNNAFRATTLLASGAWRPAAGWRIGGRADRFDKAQGVPGLGAVPAYRTHLAFARSRGRIEMAREGAGALPGARIAAGLVRERTRFLDADAELGLGRHDTDDRTGGSDVTLDLDWRPDRSTLAVTAGTAWRREWARPTDAADGHPDPPESRRGTVGGRAGIQWRPSGERLVVHAAFRRDRLRDRLRWVEAGGIARAAETTRTLDSPQIGFRWAGPSGIELRANGSDARRPPDFLELFGNQGSVTGNPALRPERARNADLGLAWSGAVGRGAAVTLDVAHFESRAEEMVVYVRHSQSSVRAENIARARIRGEELTVRLATPGALRVTGSLTHTSARDDGPVPHWNGRRLPLRPAFQAATRVDWRRGRVRAAGDLQYLGEDFLDRANLQRVPGRLLFGALLSYEPPVRGLRVTLEGKNLGDERASDVAGFPLPGRSFFASCEVSLGPRSPSTP